MRGPGKHRTHRVRRVTALAVLALAGAGCVAWFGQTTRATDERTNLATITLPAEALPGDTRAGLATVQGALPTRLVAVAAGIDAPITEVGVVLDNGKPVWETAWRSVGHHIDSSRPGQPGNMVLTGHVSVSDARNLAAFRTLDRLQAGDLVEIYAGDDLYRYRITTVAVVPPDDIRVLRADHRARLTLITCTKDLRNRLVVVGVLV